MTLGWGHCWHQGIATLTVRWRLFLLIRRFQPGKSHSPSHWEFLVRVCRPVLQILTLFQTKKCHFPHPFWDQFLVVQKLDNATHVLSSVIFIRWIVIYPANSAIHLLNNRGLVSEACTWFCQQMKSRLDRQGKDFLKSVSNSLINSYNPVVPLKTTPDIRQKWAKSTSLFQTETEQKPCPLGQHIPLLLI